MTDHRFQDGGVRFVPGPAVGIVGPRTVALIDSDPRSLVVKDLWSVISSGGAFAEITEVLISHGIASLPPVVIAHLDSGGVRVLVRGAMAVSLRPTAGAADVMLEAPEVTTWIEHVEAQVDRVAMFDRSDLAEVGAFRTTGGVVPAARIEVDLRTVAPAAADPFDRDLPNLRPGPVQQPRSWVPDPLAAEAVEPVEAVVAEDALPSLAEFAMDESSVPDEPTAPDAIVAPGGGPSYSPAPSRPGELDGVVDVDRANATVRFEDDLAGPAAVDLAVLDDDSVLDDGILLDDIEDETSDVEVDELEALGVDHPDEQSGAADSTDEDDYDHLFGVTQFRSVSSAGVSEPDGTPSPGDVIGSIPSTTGTVDAAMAPDLGDHDGMTIGVAQLRALQANSASPVSNISAPSTISSMVHAVACPSGHHNPPSATTCRKCGVEIPDQAHVSVPRPVLGLFRFSSGEERAITRPMLLGRSPTADGMLGGELPELVPLPSPMKELSGTHLEVRIEGWQVIVVDRRSTNGTTVRLPHRDPQRLHPGEPFPIVPGTIVDLADEVQFTFEVEG